MANLIRHPSDEGVIHAAPDTAPSSKEVGRWVLVATILGSSMAMIDGTAVNVALPVLQRSLNASVSQAQWIVEAYALFLGALILVGGSLGDLFGRKRIFAIGITIFVLASTACGLSQNSTELILARAIQGIGGALMVPGSLAIIGSTFSKEQRGRAIGTWSGFTVITGALGPVLGGWLVGNVSWRGVFFLNIPLALAVLVILFWRVPESRDDDASDKLDWLGSILAVVGLGGIVGGLITSTDLGLGHPLVLGLLISGIIALGAFVFWEARHPHPLVPLSLFRSRAFSGANAFTLLLYSAAGALTFFLPFNLIQVQGYSPAAAGAALLPMILIVFALSRWSGGLASRFGARVPLIVGPLITATGFALMARTGLGGSYWTTFFPAVALMGLGFSISTPSLTTTVMGAVETRHAGLASGVNNAVARIAALLSVAVLGIVFLAVFSSNFASHLAASGLPVGLQQQMLAQSSKLGAIRIPAGVSSQGHAILAQSIAESFVGSFQVIMFIALGLALMGSLIAWLTISAPERVKKVGSEAQTRSTTISQA